jgi:hypothetical protein
MREWLFAPLALTHALTLPEEALLFRAAVGHVSVDGSAPTRAPVWQLPRSLGPAGLITATVADVLRFARLHLAGGVAGDGSRLLNEDSVAAMAAHQADVPDKHTLGDSWGLGWCRFDWGGRRLLGHDGNTIGQAAFLRLLPDENVAVTLLTNGGDARALHLDLFREILAELADVVVPHPLGPPDEPQPVDVGPFVGMYERASVRQEVFVDGGDGKLRVTLTGPLAEMVPNQIQEMALVPVSRNLFVCQDPDSKMWIPATFYELPTGERYLHFGVRATPKVA